MVSWRVRAEVGDDPDELVGVLAGRLSVDETGAVTGCDRLSLLPDGTEVTVRPGVPEDVPGVRAMHERCSALTRYRRYLRANPRLPERAARRLLRGGAGCALVAVGPGDRVVGLGNLEATPQPGVGEIALIVEDGWQRRGLGGALTRRLVLLGERRGVTALTATTFASNQPMLRLFSREGLAEHRRFDGELVHIRVPIETAISWLGPGRAPGSGRSR